ncbi:hypothetical protein G3496_11840 [Shewanella baltica]|uniref:hypothetical protein n=1 Tax=Shewanella baltica TaxID=62322 RepID=UPI00217DACFE|nr:hypothetical protein [Shewanella baltica]MCS6135627.1 hypothetical protein [Shewanella baltica]
MKPKVFLLLSSLTILNGCAGLDGFVNQERIQDPLTKQEELYTYITRVDKLLNIYAVDETTKASLKLALSKIETNAEGDINNSKAAKMLAEELDQINSQNYPILFSIVLGLNSNPSSEKNQEKFWESLNNITNQTYSTREREIELEIKKIELEIIKFSSHQPHNIK